MRKSTALAEIAVEGDCVVSLDRDTNGVLLHSPTIDDIVNGVKLVESRVIEC